jgi:peptidoglycan/xylan/chitin deacetylase (PgdA/CDA1 family)
MIGVVANPSEHAVVREFFELFKTPWEFQHTGRRYEVVLCAGDVAVPPEAAPLTVVYGGRQLPSDTAEGCEPAPQGTQARMLLYHDARIPVYGDSVGFRGGTDVLVDEKSRHPVLFLRQSGAETLARIGYNLFGEIHSLLTAGQPAANAGIPALELHIAVLRDLIVTHGIPLVEIPPVPEGYRFVACLTHDVDHPSVRRHRFDHTMWGFLYRAIAGSMVRVFRGRLSVRGLLRNWIAAAKLPLVQLGLARDFWSEFGRYIRIENGIPSTFFVIPFRDRPGFCGNGPAPATRAARYGAADIAAEIKELMSAACEIGVHGIDAWRDRYDGSEEFEEIRRVTGVRPIGVRMHWLYFDKNSPKILETVGAEYDSTVGYNETVGYRTGTTQVYKPLSAARLLELPLNLMDTALFYPSYLNLSPGEARQQVGRIIDNAVRHGGCVTVNWHDRSIAPERQWGDVYQDLVTELRNKGAWFASASQAVAWFRKRRSLAFEGVNWESGTLRARIAADASDVLPDMQLRIYNAQSLRRNIPAGAVAARRTPGDRGLKHTRESQTVSPVTRASMHGEQD